MLDEFREKKDEFFKNWEQWSIKKKAMTIGLVIIFGCSLIKTLAEFFMVFSFLGTFICLGLAAFKRKNVKKLLLSALGLFVLSGVSSNYVDTSTPEKKEQEVAVIESETVEVEGNVQQNNETNADEAINKPSKTIYKQNESINQWVNNLNHIHQLSLTSKDVKEGATKEKASLSLDQVHVMLSDNSQSYSMDFSYESKDSSDELIWEAFRKGFSAIGSGLSSQEFNDFVSTLKTEEMNNKGYGKVSIKGHDFIYTTQSLNTGGVRYTLKSNFKKETIFKSVLVDYQLELPTIENVEEAITSNPSENTSEEVVVQTSSSETTIHFIDTGNSDSVLIENSGKFALIDAGDRDDDAKIKTYLKNQGVSRLEYLIITHFHADHFGGADTVVNDFEVGITFVPNGDADTQVYRDFINALSNKGLKPSVPLENAVISLGEATLTFYNTKGGHSNENNDSLVTLLQSGSRKALFTGDAESQIESMLTQIGKVDVFKAGHHGSSTSNTSALLNRIKPDHVVVMVGEGNKYGHPDAEAMNRFKDLNIPVYRTDEQGTIVVTLANEGVSVNQQPGSYQAGSNSSSSSSSSNNSGGGGSTQTTTESTPTTNQESNTSTPSTSTGTKDDNPNGIYNQTSSEPKQSFKNCTLLREVYPDGVPKGHPAYESKHDRDKDSWACER